jgi:hypothetical protein
MSPNPETARRRELAQRIVAALGAQTRLTASLLTGSTAQDACLPDSDLDLLNYYEELPPRERFDEVMRGLGAEEPRDITPPGAAEFVAGYRVEGVEVQTGAQLVASIERGVAAVERGEVDWAAAKLASGLLDGEALFGATTIGAWQRRVAYPEALRRREVQAGLGFFPVWRLDGYLAARDAELFRRQMLLDGAFRVLRVLSGLNRLYFTTFQFKRAAHHVGLMAVRPDGLAQRLDVVANAAPGEAARELEAIVAETKALVARELPDVDVEAPWQPAG